MKNFILTTILFMTSLVCQAGYVTFSGMTQSVSGNSGETITATVNVHGWGGSQEVIYYDIGLCNYDNGFLSGIQSGSVFGNETRTLTFKFKKTVTTTSSFTYTFSTQGIGQCSNNVISITVTYYPQICNLPTPTGLTSTVLSHTASKLNWTKNASAASYELRYKKTSDLSYTFETFTCDTNCEKLLYFLAPSTSYIWSVKAICSNGVSTPYAPDKTFTTQACPIIAPPTNITATPYSYGYTINFSPAGSYMMEYVNLVNGSTGTTTIATSNPGGMNFFYYVGQNHSFKFRLKSFDVCGIWSDWVTVEGVQCSSDNYPTNLTVYSQCGSSGLPSTCGGIVQWTRPANTNSYQIEYIIYNVAGQTYTGTILGSYNSQTLSQYTSSSLGPWMIKVRAKARCIDGTWSDYSPWTNPQAW